VSGGIVTSITISLVDGLFSVTLVPPLNLKTSTLSFLVNIAWFELNVVPVTNMLVPPKLTKVQSAIVPNHGGGFNLYIVNHYLFQQTFQLVF